MKICPVGDKLFHEDGQRDRLTDIFCNFVNVPNKSKSNKPKKDWYIINIHKYAYE
jgi:hypothetical protein